MWLSHSSGDDRHPTTFPHNRANSQESDGASNDDGDDEVSDGTGCSKLGPTKTTANESATTAMT